MAHELEPLLPEIEEDDTDEDLEELPGWIPDPLPGPDDDPYLSDDEDETEEDDDWLD